MEKRSIAVLAALVILFTLGACAQKADEKTYSITLDEDGVTWSYLMDPEGVVKEVSNTANLVDQTPMRTWSFQGVSAGETTLVFFDGVNRTVRYNLFVDENLEISELKKEDTRETEDMVMEGVAAILANQYQNGAQYTPTGTVSDQYAVGYLQAYANLFRAGGAQAYPEIQNTGYNKYISLDEKQVDAILDVAFGGRYTTANLPVDGKTIIFNAHAYYIGVKDIIEISVAAAGEAGTYVYTVTTDQKNIDGTIKVALKASDKNSSGNTIVGLQAISQ